MFIYIYIYIVIIHIANMFVKAELWTKRGRKWVFALFFKKKKIQYFAPFSKLIREMSLF